MFHEGTAVVHLLHLEQNVHRFEQVIRRIVLEQSNRITSRTNTFLKKSKIKQNLKHKMLTFGVSCGFKGS